ncbi:MAG TPA: Fic family protein, partial [Terriglobia bacterium]|nr:Fic family protein [Terriglobia bacterium]
RGPNLKSRVQFQGLDKKRDQWVSVKSQVCAQLRFEELLRSRWGRQNCALDDTENPGLWNADILDEERARQLDFHWRAVRGLVSLAQMKTHLCLQDLLDLHGLILSGNSGQGKLRNTWIESLASNHQPAESELLPEIVANALEWFDSDSFYEIHEVEQMALFLGKLLDILPFQRQNGRTLRLAANFFLLRAGFPPAIIASSRADHYCSAIDHGLRLETQPLVDLLAGSLLESLHYCLGEKAPAAAFHILV